ncbi:Gfo/Idh/MocA family protein [Flavobacterium algicola]|uniref:Gfo/Idh/MocA family protein n=1 Tax=Flavobacterium algicola TaxID=556529 RepID=UPI001EFED263|nr:Gfo/Idh/MocA family oxidoreductase [Flavobacterium algicola]MCG9792026.1 Gfo/Idh/MocA family oxidoreductase [Flavobacterium algicola]
MSKTFEKNKNIRWGIIGCGNVTEVKSGPAYQNVSGFELAGVMRRDAQKCADYAQRHGIEKHYTDADELINDPEIDAIYIATPPDSHALYGLKVAAAGKPCCIEKPMATSYEESLMLYNAFTKKDIPLFVAYYRRSLPRFTQIKKWIDDNEIGKIRHVSWHLSKTASEQDLSGDYNWRTDIRVAKGGYFDDLASHGIDLFEYLLGDIAKVSGFTINQQDLYTAKDAIVASWIHESGITGSGSWNFGCATREDVVQIIGSEGKIEFSIFEENPIALTNANGKREQFINHPDSVQFYHVQNMREHLLGNVTHPSTGKTALHTSWVLEQILKS